MKEKKTHGTGKAVKEFMLPADYARAKNISRQRVSVLMNSGKLDIQSTKGSKRKLVRDKTT